MRRLAALLLLSVCATAATAHGAVRAPALQHPAEGAQVAAIPVMSWHPVRGAVQYEFQLSADRNFGSIVLGRGRGSFRTGNTAATVPTSLPDGDYWWRVRAIDARNGAGAWSGARSLRKRWLAAPQLTGPVGGLAIPFPAQPLVLQWTRSPGATRYLVDISTDPTLAAPAPGITGRIDTSGNQFTPPAALAPGRYHWAVTPVDAEGHRGTRSSVGSFVWTWDTRTATRVQDLEPDPRLYDPQFSWDPIDGAAAYKVEVNTSEDFPAGSAVCCAETVIGNSLSPLKVLANNRYHWRVRAIDPDGTPGLWNVGTPFEKSFDPVAPSVPSLRLRDNLADPATDLGGGTVATVETPVVTWEPIKGATSYEVQVAPFQSGCNWTSGGRRDFLTASTAWTPLSPRTNGRVPGGVAFEAPASDSPLLSDGGTYCVRVAARSDRTATGDEVVSDWTQLNGIGQPGFRFRRATVAPAGGSLVMPAENYRLPQSGGATSRLPLFTWVPVPGAQSYFVVVAKDPSFTTIVDVALTQVPAYAPRGRSNVTTYPDETTSYYWVVMPATGDNGDGVTTQPQQNSPQAFEKRSVPAQLMGPAEGADVADQPTFRWTSVEGAREYRLQVAQDPTFADRLDDVTTSALAHTSSTTYPVDSLLYWRVRAADERRVGLTWSRTGTFRRRLPTPVPSADTPTEGGAIPLLRWSPVQGAVSYDLHVEQADGTRKDFTVRSPAFTPTTFYGTGVWRWQVRASFPARGGTASGAYSPLRPFTRRIVAPTGLRAQSRRGRLVLAWAETVMAKRYLVEVSDTNSFGRVVDRVRTDGTSWAPRLVSPLLRSAPVLHWRVAALDEGNNAGAFATGRVVRGRTLRVRATGALRRDRLGKVTIIVTDGAGRAVRGAVVSVKGAARRRTTRSGRLTLRVRPRRAGRLGVIVSKTGYGTARTTIRVR